MTVDKKTWSDTPSVFEKYCCFICRSSGISTI